jgi:hypothetical protein
VRIEIGKPVSADLHFVNIGNVITVARARWTILVTSNAVDDVTNSFKEKSATELASSDTKGFTQIILPANSGANNPFPIDSPSQVITAEDLGKIRSGQEEVVVYGRIYYYSPGIPREVKQSLFCFYLLKDGKTISVCPNHIEHTEEQGKENGLCHDRYTNVVR